MSFRCLFIIRLGEIDKSDLYPYCYKPFDNVNKIKLNENPNSVILPNFSEWYNCVITTLSDASSMKIDDSNIKDYLCNPIFKIETNFDILEPCILITKNNFIFGGLIYQSATQKSRFDIQYKCATNVDFICGMTSYFLNYIKKNPKIKMIDLMPEFYYFIKIMCPYGTPITSNSNLVEFFKNPESMKSLSIPYSEKSIVSINQLPIRPLVKNKELKLTFKEIVTGVQHENKHGQPKYDIDIIGEVIVSTSNLDISGEISFTIKSNLNSKFFSRALITDVLLHPSCVSLNYRTPITISMQSRKPTNEFTDSPISPMTDENFLSQSVSKRYSTVDSLLLNRTLQTISRNQSIISENEVNKLSSSMNLIIKPWADSYTLLSYKIMQRPIDSDPENVNIPFISSCKYPEPPVLCSYQLEDISSTTENISNVIFRIKLNPEVFLLAEKGKSPEFSNFEVIFPFHNRAPLSDITKCTASQGKLIILEQNRHLMAWIVGSSLKKNEASVIGSITFQADATQTPFIDNFCVQSNAYVQVNFTLKSTNLSGLSGDTKSFTFTKDVGVKITQKQECTSYNYKVWNSLGVCPFEIFN